MLLIATTQTWVTASGLGETSAVQQVDVPGTDIAEAATAMALVGLAGGVALTIARRTMRRVIGMLLFAAGTFSLYTAGSVIASPGPSSLAALGEITGTTELAQGYELAGAVWLAALGSALLAAAGLAVLLLAGRWRDAGASRKYDRRAAAIEPDRQADEFDLWDGLSEGEDLTDRG